MLYLLLSINIKLILSLWYKINGSDYFSLTVTGMIHPPACKQTEIKKTSLYSVNGAPDKRGIEDNSKYLFLFINDPL